MKIFYAPNFVTQFNTIWDYIANDSVQRANHFKQKIKNKIENLQFMPYMYRKSYYFDDEDIRDLIYKGYVVPYKITKKSIIILGIIKYKESF